MRLVELEGNVAAQVSCWILNLSQNEIPQAKIEDQAVKEYLRVSGKLSNSINFSFLLEFGVLKFYSSDSSFMVGLE